MKKIKFILLFFIYSLTSLASQLVINSEPANAIIYLRKSDSDKLVKFAKTPYKGKLEDLQNIVGQTAFTIEIKKVGFIPYRLLLANLKSSDIKLKVSLEVNNDIKFTQDYDLLVDDLFDVQKFVRTKDYSTALEKLKLLDKKFPYFSIIDELRASVYYLQKDFKRSLAFYRSAFEKNSKNRDAYKMKNYLEKKFNLTKKK